MGIELHRHHDMAYDTVCSTCVVGNLPDGFVCHKLNVNKLIAYLRQLESRLYKVGTVVECHSAGLASKSGNMERQKHMLLG